MRAALCIALLPIAPPVHVPPATFEIFQLELDYALPNPAPAVNVFTIVPRSATAIQYGIVEPANGQPGGGVEVIFTRGTTVGTVSGPTKIPPG